MNLDELHEELDKELSILTVKQFKELGAKWVGECHYFPFKQNDEGEVFPRKITPEYVREVIDAYIEEGANAYRLYRPMDSCDGHKLVFVLFCQVPYKCLDGMRLL